MKRLVELRTTNNLTQKQVAQNLDIERATYARYEAGSREPDFSTLRKLAAYFGVSIDFLLGVAETEKSSNTILSDQYYSRFFHDDFSGLSDIEIDALAAIAKVFKTHHPPE